MTPIDLRSDTVTKPTPAMREVMAQAPVGDDVYGEDPTVNRLQATVAALLGKQAAVFVPSGIMANQLALRVQAQPGDEAIVESRAHVLRYEVGSAAALSGIQLQGIATDHGIMTAAQVEAAIRPIDPYSARTALISIENTHNSGGGSIYPIDTIKAIRGIADAHRLPMHLDGARLFNAVVATGIPAVEYARYFETVSVCLSKGLGAPVGSLVASSTEIVERLKRLRRLYGGGMRQAGILAAAGLYALEHHVARLKDDHARAQQLARRLQAVPSLTVHPCETNIVIVDLPGRRAAAEVVTALRAQGVLLNAVGPHRVRAVTHLDVDDAGIARAADIMIEVLGHDR